MIKQIKDWLQNYADMTHAAHYLSNHITYSLNNTRDTEYVKFNKSQLRFIVISKWNLSQKQINKVINLACNSVMGAKPQKTNFMVTKNSIYVAVCQGCEVTSVNTSFIKFFMNIIL